jgi:hypothetical protein
MLKIYFFLPLLFLLTTCGKNNPDPSWLQINAWELNVNPNYGGAEGSLNHNISEAWVYVNDEVMGVFQLPCKIPILKAGTFNIKIMPAIKNNGIASTKKIYPFLDIYEVTGTLVQNQTLVLSPVTKYKDNISFTIEDFEDINSSLIPDPNTSATTYQLSNTNLEWFNGNYYAKINLNAVDSTWVAYTNWTSYIAKGKDAYLEVDYHTTNTIVTELIEISPSGTVPRINYGMNAQDPSTVTWKKIYIDLKELIAAGASGAYFEQGFVAALDAGKTDTEIWIDNIKLVHF